MSMEKQLLPPIKPLATMAEAWAERDRMRAEAERMRAEGLRMMAEADRMRAEGNYMWAERLRTMAEGDRMRAEADRMKAEGDLIVLVTAQSLYEEDVQIDWKKRVVIGKRR